MKWGYIMQEINFFNYGEYSSNNYGSHSLCFITPAGRFWISYNTLVAFEICGEFHIIKNYWGTTTGKHLNWINPDHRIREDDDVFNENLTRLKERGFCNEKL